MKNVTLGKTGIVTPQNAFGALPVQRVGKDEAIDLLRRAFEGGMLFFDTARGYTDSEEKLGLAFEDIRKKLYIATKTHAVTTDGVKRDLEKSLVMLKTDYIDVYQLHNIKTYFRPDDGTGLFELLTDLKRQGVIKHIGISTHNVDIAEKVLEDGYYETLQYPFSFLSSDREKALTYKAAEKNIGFIAMKSLAGGLITDSAAAFAFTSTFSNVLPIWGIQRMSELEEWLSYMDDSPVMNDTVAAYIEKERSELTGEFCRGCGYCLPCSADIKINWCARMSLFLRRAPLSTYLTPDWQKEMEKIENCINCGACLSRCPYGLNVPELLKKNLIDYREVLADNSRAV